MKFLIVFILNAKIYQNLCIVMRIESFDDIDDSFEIQKISYLMWASL